ncbi:MAG: DnaA N-terminal domain-containing protein, partial [Alphaproteobacteria bacterium]
MENTADTLFKQWDTVCGQLQQQLGDKIAVRWLTKLVPAGLENHQLHLMAPSPCIRELVKKNYADHILSLWQRQNPSVTSVSFGLKKTEPVCRTDQPVVRPVAAPVAPIEHKIVDADGDVVSSYLDPTHTFDTFVVGKPNEFAYAAAKRVAEEKKVSFNPLYL